MPRSDGEVFMNGKKVEMLNFLRKNTTPATEPELTDIGQIVWFNPGNGHDRVPFVLTHIEYSIDGYQIRLTGKSDFDRTHLWQ